MNNPILIFDGDCIFCNRIAFHLAKTDKRNHFKFASSTSERGIQIIQKNNFQDVVNQSVIVLIGDSYFIKSEAVYHFLKQTKMYPVLRFCIKVTPLFIANLIYDLISKYRKAISTKSCDIPNPEIRHKFL